MKRVGDLTTPPIMVSRPASYLVAGLLLLVVAWRIFCVLVPRDYRQQGRLAPHTGLLELIAWLLFVAFPFIYNPRDWSRNPQLLGGFLAVIGVVVLWPSLYALGWAAMYGIMGHWMVLAEEEHLRKQNEGYERYCRRVPRYFGFPRRDI